MHGRFHADARPRATRGVFFRAAYFVFRGLEAAHYLSKVERAWMRSAVKTRRGAAGGSGEAPAPLLQQL